MDEDNVITNDVHNAIAQALTQHERAMLGPWVLVAQTTTDEGRRGVWTLTSEDILEYEAKGLLTHALDAVREQYADVAWIRDLDEDDQS